MPVGHQIPRGDAEAPPSSITAHFDGGAYLLCSSWLASAAAPPRAVACCWSCARRALLIFGLSGADVSVRHGSLEGAGRGHVCSPAGGANTNLLELCVRHGLDAGRWRFSAGSVSTSRSVCWHRRADGTGVKSCGRGQGGRSVGRMESRELFRSRRRVANPTIAA